jgi:hypothetical protein
MVDGVAFISIPYCFQFWIGLQIHSSFQCLLAGIVPPDCSKELFDLLDLFVVRRGVGLSI